MNMRRLCMLCVVIGGSIILLGTMLRPPLQALGRTPTDRGVENPLDDSGWSALGTGISGQVRTVVISGTEVYVGGMFSSAGNCTTGCNNIAKWNTLTHSWSALGSGVDGQVQTIAVYNGLVYAGGDFANAGPVAANRIAMWDGSDWTALNEGVNGAVHAIAVSDGAVYVGGEFTQAGSCTGASHGCYFVAIWNSSGWAALSHGTDSYVQALADGGMHVYVGGLFGSAGNVSHTLNIALWDKPGWYPLDTGTNGAVNAIAVQGDDVYVGGLFNQAGSMPVTSIAKWNSVRGWSVLGAGVGDNAVIRTIAVGSNDVYVGGDFKDNDNGTPNHIAKWNSASGWSALGSGTDGKVYAIAVTGSEVYVGGSFTSAGGMENTTGIAKYQIASIKVFLPLILRASY